MNRGGVAWIMGLIVVVLSADTRPATAGSFFFPQQCQSVSTNPPRYRLRFVLSDHRYFGPLCEVRLDPIPFNGSPARPILGGLVPQGLQFAVDPAGSAHLTASPCLAEPWFFAESLYVIVDAVPAYFDAVLLTTDGALAHIDLAAWPCANPVGVDLDELPRQAWFAVLVPNPASVATALRFGLPRETRVRLSIHDIAGRTLRTLIDGALPAGSHTAAWDLRDGEGREAPSGLYLARLDAGGTVLTRRLIRTR